jgi:hypothetical protein
MPPRSTFSLLEDSDEDSDADFNDDFEDDFDDYGGDLEDYTVTQAPESVYSSDEEDDITSANIDLNHFNSGHLIPMFPYHPNYPDPDSKCAICKEGFGSAHPPILVVGIEGCKGHVFGYECLREAIGSGRPNSNTCPLCRTKWFDMSRQKLAELKRHWDEISGEERKEADGD